MLIESLLRNGLQGRTDSTTKKVDYIAKRYTENIRKRLADYGYKAAEKEAAEADKQLKIAGSI